MTTRGILNSMSFVTPVRKWIDDVRYNFWTKHQNGNVMLQTMMGDLAVLEDQLQAARKALRDGDTMEAGQLVDMAIETAQEHQDTLREIL